jgi:hypothetical protein
MCLAPFATVWKAGVTWYHPQSTLLQYVSLLIFKNFMFMKRVLCNRMHYINEVYKCMYIYAPAVEAIALTVFTVWPQALITRDYKNV